MIKLVFLPYALLFSHRGISHTPIVGTLTRLAYLAPLWLLTWEAGLEWQSWMGYIIVGLMVSDLTHWLRDKVWKARQ